MWKIQAGVIRKGLNRFSISLSFTVRLFLWFWLGFHLPLTMCSSELGCDGTEKVGFLLYFYFLSVSLHVRSGVNISCPSPRLWRQDLSLSEPGAH